jgi:hypothetical protein
MDLDWFLRWFGTCFALCPVAGRNSLIVESQARQEIRRAEFRGNTVIDSEDEITFELIS